MRAFALLLALSIPAVAADLYVPHIAQGHGWQTTLLVINTCDQPVDYFGIDFFDHNGDQQEFKVTEERLPWTGAYSNEPLGKNGIALVFPNLEDELISGYGIVQDETGCIRGDIIYTQERENPNDADNPYISYATIVPQEKVSKQVIAFFSGEGCETALALAGMGGSVKIEAHDLSTGDFYGRHTVRGVKHTAFEVSEVIPRLKMPVGAYCISMELRP